MSLRIISPIDRYEEAALLLEAGADELYGGFVSAPWRERFGLLGSPNQRTFAQAQFDTFEDLARVVETAHGAGKTFSLTLNAPFYTDRQMPLLLDLVEETVQAGIDGVILADLGLLALLQKRHPQLEYHASTLAHLMNSEAVRFYQTEGIDRVVFPRHLTTAEMAKIVAACPQVRFDAFLLIGKCPNTEGLCTFHHSSPDRIWPCEIPYRITPQEEPASETVLAAIVRQKRWSVTNRRHGCGLCAIPALRRAGLFGVKLVGRGAPTAQKVQNVSLVREFLNLASTQEDFAAYRRAAVAAHRRRFGAGCDPNVCYYPEYYLGE